MSEKSSLKTTKNPLKRTLEAVSSEGPPSKKPATGSSSKSRLSSPFRSPLTSSTPNPATQTSTLSKSSAHKDHVFAVPAVPSRASKPSAIPTHVLKRTAGSPFKSPLMTKPTSSAVPPKSVPVTAPSPQERLETLRRATRLLKEDEGLKVLISKWRSVGREAATDLCALIEESGIADNGSGEAGQSDSRGSNGDSNAGGFDNNWGYGQPTQSRFDKSWGWLDADSKPDSGWGWATVAEHVNSEDATDLGLDSGSPEDEELPSPKKLMSMLGSASKKPYVQRKSLLSPAMTSSDFLLPAPPDDEVDTHLGSNGEEQQENEAAVQNRPWGMGRMLRELGIPKELLGWSEEAEDWVDADAKKS